MVRPLFVLRFAGIATIVAQILVWYPRQAIRSDYADTDLDVFHHTAVKVARGEPIYGEARASLRQPPHSLLYPPTFAALIRPAAALDVAQFAKIWYGLVLVAYWLFAWGLARLAFPAAGADHVLGVGTVLQLVPSVYWTMGLGNVDIMVWALVAWALSVTSTWGVVLLVAAAWIKAYPIFALPVMLVRGPRLRAAPAPSAASDRSWAAGVAVILAGCTLAIVAANGWRYAGEWLRVGLPSLASGCLHWYNASLTTLLIRPFVDPDAPALPAAAQMFLRLAPLAGVGITLWATRRLHPVAQMAVVVLTALWLSPVFWLHQLGIAALGVAVWRGRTRAPETVADRPVQAAPASP
jgi:hypothetical protein